MIDIIIPVYNDKNNLELALMSVAMQSIRDFFNIYIIDDASNCNYEHIIRKFSKELKIKYFKLEKNMGAGLARQYGIFKSNSPYISFLDSDDLLFNPKSMEYLYKTICSGMDYVTSIEFDERYNIYCDNENSLHGKMYSRFFIYEKMIKFNDTKFHEDCFFNNLVLICSPKKASVDKVTYFYSNNKKSTTSITRTEYFSKFNDLFYNIKLILDYAYNNNCKAEAINSFIYGKQKYLKSVYSKLDEIERAQFFKWINDYKLEKELLQIFK